MGGKKIKTAIRVQSWKTYWGWNRSPSRQTWGGKCKRSTSLLEVQWAPHGIIRSKVPDTIPNGKQIWYWMAWLKFSATTFYAFSSDKVFKFILHSTPRFLKRLASSSALRNRSSSRSTELIYLGPKVSLFARIYVRILCSLSSSLSKFGIIKLFFISHNLANARRTLKEKRIQTSTKNKILTSINKKKQACQCQWVACNY